MAKILLAGDSWGIGVFSQTQGNYGPTGEGIHTVLQSLGHDVVNISKAGGANWLMMDRLNHNWNNDTRCFFGVDPEDRKDFNIDKIDYVVFLQTDIFREQYWYIKEHPDSVVVQKKWLSQDFVDSLLNFNSIQDFIDQYFESFYTELNNFAHKNNKKILCVGGWNKLHPSISHYNNLVPVITSACQFLVPDLKEDVFLSDPEWFVQLDDNPKIVEKFNTELKTLALQTVDKYNKLIVEWNDCHPKLGGYQKIALEIASFFDKKLN
jgi:hypothetical protein